MESILVSVIITTFNGQATLKRAIETAIGQMPLGSIEIIVVDDNNPHSFGRKATEMIMSAYSDNDYIIYVKHEKNMNGSIARNSGVVNARGKYINYLDDDDFFLEGKISKCVVAIEKNPEYDAVLTDVVVTDDTEIVDVITQSADKDMIPRLFLEWPLGTGSNLFLTRKSVDALGGFDEAFLRRQDIEFMIRFFMNFKAKFINEQLTVKVVQQRKNVTLVYTNFSKVENQFIEKFRSTIETKLSEKQREAYFEKTYKGLYSMALSSKNPKLVQEARKNLCEYRPLTCKESLFGRFHYLYAFLKGNQLMVRCVRALQKRKAKNYRQTKAKLVSKVVSDSIFSIINRY